MKTLFLILLTIFTYLGLAEDLDPGAVTFRDNCSACHQFDGSGNESMKAPAISGLPRWYVSDQLRKFRAGERGGDTKDASGYLMHMTALKLDDRIIAYLGRYVQNLKPVAARHTKDFGSENKGQETYNAKCSHCHGKEGIGNKSDRIPPLNKQPDWYLVNQLNKFQSSQRLHTQKEAIPKLSETEMKDVASYLANLKEKN